MPILNATETRSRPYSLIDQAADTHQPIVGTPFRSRKRAGTLLLQPFTCCQFPE